MSDVNLGPEGERPQGEECCRNAPQGLPMFSFVPMQGGGQRQPDPPHRVLIALKYVDMISGQLGLRGWPGPAGVEYHEQELHPAQEDALMRACKLLGNYFDGQVKE